MKFFVVVALTLLALNVVSATYSALRLKAKMEQMPGMSGSLSNYIQSTTSQALSQSAAAAAVANSESSFPATKLTNLESSACSGGSCGGRNAINWARDSGDDETSRINTVVKPIDDWMKDFKARTAGNGGDLMAAAKATIKPMLDRLKQTQEAAVDKLINSNQEILARVEQTATEHVYNMLRAEKITEDKAEQNEAKKARLDELKGEAEIKATEAKVLESSESSHGKKF